MHEVAITPSPGFISIAVNDVARSAAFYERYLGGIRDTFDFGPESAVFVGWPTYALSAARRPGQPGPSPDTTSIQLWWRASDPQVLYERASADAVPIIAEPFDGPFGGRSRWPTPMAIGSRSTSATSHCSGHRRAEERPRGCAWRS